MKRYLLVIILFLSYVAIHVNCFSQEPPYAWARGIGGKQNDDAEKILVDARGNVYTSGYYSDTVDFDPGTGSFIMTPARAGALESYLLKLDALGRFVWAKRIVSTSSSILASIQNMCFDNAGNLCLTGNFADTADFDIGSATHNEISEGGSDAYVMKVDTSGNGVKATVKTATGEITLEADILLSAVGVVANIENIGLEQLGIKTDKGKIVVDPYQQTTVKGVYAIGDCTPGQALAHVASKEGINAAEHLAGHHPTPLDYNNIPGCTYCTPEIASVGYTEKAAKDAGYEIKVGKFPFMASGKASAAGATEGFVKVIYDAKYGEFLGCHMIGSNVTEMIAEAVVARKLETTAQEILNAVHPHPTMSEGLKEATAVAYGEATDV